MSASVSSYEPARIWDWRIQLVFATARQMPLCSDDLLRVDVDTLTGQIMEICLTMILIRRSSLGIGGPVRTQSRPEGSCVSRRIVRGRRGPRCGVDRQDKMHRSAWSIESVQPRGRRDHKSQDTRSALRRSNSASPSRQDGPDERGRRTRTWRGVATGISLAWPHEPRP
jgi:hypothetical protein